MGWTLDLSPRDRPRSLPAERNGATFRALLRELLADCKPRFAAGFARRRISRPGGVPACACWSRIGAMLAVSSRHAMRMALASHGAGCAALFRRRGTLRGMSAANRKGCEKDAEDCLSAHEGECEQSRAPLVYVDPHVCQSVY